MYSKSIKILPKRRLIYKRQNLVDEDGHLTKNGLENFFGILSTLLLNYTSEKEPEWLKDNFNVLLKSQLSIGSSFRIFMMSFYNHKFPDEVKRELFDQLSKPVFNDNFLLNEGLHDLLQEAIIDEISLYRNMDLANFLIKDASYLIGIFSGIKKESSTKILRRISKKEFEKNLPNIIQNKIPSEKKTYVATKVILYNCIRYQYYGTNLPEILILKFGLEAKSRLLFYEQMFSFMRDNHKSIIEDINNEYLKSRRKNNDKGLGR